MNTNRTMPTPARPLGAALAAILTALSLAGPAAAGAGLESEGHVRAEGDRYGLVKINGAEIEFAVHGSVEHALAEAIGAAGYHAWVQDGCVFVEFEGHRPSLWVRLEGYSFSTHREGWTLVIRPIKLFSYGHHEYRRPPVVVRRGFDRPGYRGRFDGPGFCDVRFNVNFGGPYARRRW